MCVQILSAKLNQQIRSLLLRRPPVYHKLSKLLRFLVQVLLRQLQLPPIALPLLPLLVQTQTRRARKVEQITIILSVRVQEKIILISRSILSLLSYLWAVSRWITLLVNWWTRIVDDEVVSAVVGTLHLEFHSLTSGSQNYLIKMIESAFVSNLPKRLPNVVGVLFASMTIFKW
jgi:hypothetical protein